ncbi:ethanolamine ammonia-lyase subunit EutC [Methylotenera sp.]|uniref:ethanolamine ammonia-lyase subunit EutC n=1 Tax=Methylotenera sp. TaxID=2051956 RepID=UPI002731BD39|nr:ethanolamine ammonia-lyase subunit EutC [Methylotenera sp.]MDP2071715.1 ethanolamine ammonia-lyase subunit EutC [Methylotenera sp.]MDP2230889.1 ethanolamine ammonia-lyase subunit EutC [Methylotenera sp.]MDP3006078.1 ethanolamine ammonia-lyase subunit EutC [Methylotenera sp.]MDP3140747.1 ethanolamine ammonia-lyase subunit EutC [Methylotenera sp.]
MSKIPKDISPAAHLSVDPWRQLKGFTRARIALGRAGSSLPTKEVLDFGLAHAMARDAVHLMLDIDALESGIQSQGFKTIRVHSKAPDRPTYLLRPDLGRRLTDQSLAELERVAMLSRNAAVTIDFMIVVGDGLSSLAVAHHVTPLLAEALKYIPAEWKLGPVVIASQARVALADEIGQVLGARMVAMLIGERPGLSSPDSLGIYLTYHPRLGLSDADRNCISNVRPEGLHYVGAAKKLLWLAKEAARLKVSGVALKDESDIQEIDQKSMLHISKL